MFLKNSHRFDGLRARLNHAFSLEEEQGFRDDEVALMEKAADFILRRKLEAAAILGLVTVKPLNFIGSQMLIFLQPFLVLFFNEEDYKRLISILSKREGIETFVQMLEAKCAADKAEKHAAKTKLTTKPIHKEQ